MAKILLLGATGRTGQRVIHFALEAGHEVVALARSPEKLEIKSDKLSIVKGTPESVDDLRTAISGCDAVISTLNNNRASDSPFAKPLNAENFMTNIMSMCVQVMEEEGVKRLVVMTALGAGDSFDYSPWLFRLMIRKTNLGIAYRDHEGQESIIKSSNLNWTIGRPVGLNDKPSKKSLGVDYGPPKKVSMMIERDKVAGFFVDCLEDESSYKKVATLFEKK